MYNDERLVVLDADGTTVDAFDAIKSAFSREGMELGDLIRFQKRRNIFKYLGGIKEFPTNLKKQITKKKRRQLVSTLTEVYRHEARLFPGIPEMINYLIDTPDIRVGMITRNITDNAAETLRLLFQRHDIDIDRLDFFIHIPLKQAKTDYFRKIRSNFDINPALSYACGDEKKDYEAAIASGLFPFIVSYGFESRERLIEKVQVPSELIIHSPQALADRIFHTLKTRTGDIITS